MRSLLAALLVFLTLSTSAQVRYSFATDLSGFRNFSPGQKFWAIGQTIQVHAHLSKKEGLYAWLVYYSPGRFSNDFIAKAKDPSTNPASLRYTVKGLWHTKEFSFGYRHYFKGSFDAEKDWNLYGLAGLGLMFTGVKNTLKEQVDTSLYILPATPVNGTSSFRRLTLDLGMGAEVPLRGDFYFYGDVRTLLPASSNPSPYFHRDKNIPLPLMVNIGVRILFGFSY